MYLHSAGSAFQQCPAHDAETNNPANIRETYFTAATKKPEAFSSRTQNMQTLEI